MAEPIPTTSPRPKLTITQEAIDRAVTEDSGHCVIAEAIREQVPEASAVSVDLQAVRWTDRKKGLRYVYFTPPYAQDLLLAFDLGMTIKPQTIKMGARSRYSRSRRPVVRARLSQRHGAPSWR